MFDQSQEILIEGTVARFDWVNPHMYLIVETTGPDGESVLIEGEGLAITQALVDGLDRDALQPGTPVIMRANPNRRGGDRQVRILDVTTQDGEIHPFYATNLRTRALTPAESLEGDRLSERVSVFVRDVRFDGNTATILGEKEGISADEYLDRIAKDAAPIGRFVMERDGLRGAIEVGYRPEPLQHC